MLERYDPRNWPISYDGVIHTLIVLGSAVALALLAHWIVFALLRRVTRSSESALDDVVVEAVRKPLRWAAIAFAIAAAAENDALVGRGWDLLARFLVPAVIGWVAYAMVRGLARGYEAQVGAASDPVAQRGRLTRIAILSRTVKVGIIIVTVSLIMLNIPGVRDVGTTMLASAGLAALAVGAAAQPALKSLIAGVQMALTEPINIDDVVIVEGEWGRIEDIRTTYVVVKIWDERRLIVPTSQFLEGAFENWTKKTAQLLGSVMLYLDPATRIAPIRAEFERQIADNPRWDGRVQVVQVTDTKRDAIEVRLLMSAKDSPTLFDLRCDIREGMLEWLADHQPAAFARLRLMNGEAEPETTGPAPDS
ncbi:MAG TPA: mechanosensitive ion channel protein MscS [Erythrobacter sp.]|nr:mechanosensitive ion channel protein MscS [Erythrobacter sp.]